ncbi:MAG: nucleotidyltransferase domain-containing protein [Candidatus Diapherotrites archaeon]|nr:nucleotidyltransferase domain-containing protein [Candidatus Diapherotrites archaeon]
MRELFSPFAAHILEILVDGPRYVRELAEQTGLAPSTVHKTLWALAQNQMVLSEKQKNRKVFVLNPDSPLAQKLISLIWTAKILNTNGFRQLKRLDPDRILLFGSAHTGKLSKNSDIDLAIFADKKIDSFALSEIKTRLATELGREINMIPFSAAKLDDMRRKKTELLNQLKYKSTVLWGTPLEIDR